VQIAKQNKSDNFSQYNQQSVLIMASMFDNYNEGYTISSSYQPERPPIERLKSSSGGYVSMANLKSESQEIFKRQKMQIDLQNKIVNLAAVNNNWMVLLLSSQILFRMNMKDPNNIDGEFSMDDSCIKRIIKCFCSTEIFVEKFLKNLKISKLFLDPTGSHLLIATVPVAPVTPTNVSTAAELYYLNKNSTKPKVISKVGFFNVVDCVLFLLFFQFRGIEITAVAYNYENQSETTTGSILLGSSKGLIFETELSVEGERLAQPNWKQVSEKIQFFESLLLIEL
jgi:vacuolar protein sorting-associated protein 18